MTKLDYESKPPHTPPDAGMTMSYLLLFAPLPIVVLAGSGSLGHRADAKVLVVLCVCLGLAIGAAIHILRRRPRDGAAWLALIAWGGLSLVGVISAIWP